MDKFKVLDLFSGIGGFSLGLDRTGGFETVAFCERQGFPCRVLRKHWPAVPIFEDVRTLTRSRLKAHGIFPNVICGGFPCQDISTAGHGAGLAGERSGLWSELRRLIREIRPLYCLVENVAALRSRGLDRVLGDLAALGYDAEWHCLPASVFGAPHRRDRIWIVAYPSGQRQIGLCLDREDIADLGDGEQPRAAAQRPCLRPEWPGEDPSQGAPGARVRRVDDGLPFHLDRIAGLGNAVCPPVVEVLGRAILDHHRGGLTCQTTRAGAA